jgi:hypothetical protein
MERGVGMDRTLWRLPALLVDDFDKINPELLHSAYVEVILTNSNNILPQILILIHNRHYIVPMILIIVD